MFFDQELTNLIDRSSDQSCSTKKGVLKNFAKFAGKQLCQSVLFNKVAGLRLWTLTQAFSCEFAKFLRIPFLQNTSWRLLLILGRHEYRLNLWNIIEMKILCPVFIPHKYAYKIDEMFVLLLKVWFSLSNEWYLSVVLRLCTIEHLVKRHIMGKCRQCES